MNNSISILDIVHDTTVDGPGFRTAIYAAGCQHKCQGCHNPQSWDIHNGTLRSIDWILEQVKEAEFADVTFTGGDPLMQPDAFTELAKRIRKETDKTIWCYTGYKFEQIIQFDSLSQILPYIDVLVDGRFFENLYKESLRFAGSTNQRLIDITKTLETGRITMWTPAFSSIPYKKGVLI